MIEQSPETRRRILAAKIPPRLRGLSLIPGEQYPLSGFEITGGPAIDKWTDLLYGGNIVRAEGQFEYCGRGIWAMGPMSAPYLTALMRDFMVQTPATGLYVTVDDFLESCRPERDPALSERAALVDLLVLANVGAEDLTKWTEATVRGLLLKRFEEGLPTLVSALCDPSRYLVESLARDVFIRVGIMKESRPE